MFRAADKWLFGYLASLFLRPRKTKGVRHLMVCFANHFEPFRGGADRRTALERVRQWSDSIEQATRDAKDSEGGRPVQSFFYPVEDYDAEALEMLADMTGRGFGEVEIHLHHRNDTVENLSRSLGKYRELLNRVHGLLGTDANGLVRFGFVHGNWALCNSRPDGDWCGVNEELSVLIEAGCYADFTFPSAPSPTQPRMVNVIYRANDIPGRSRGHDSGKVVTRYSTDGERKGLMIIPGPLSLNWRRRKWGLLPSLDNSAIEPANILTLDRACRAAAVGIHVRGMPEWIFAKFHLHGCVERVAHGFLREWGPAVLSEMAQIFNDSATWKLHWVTARELYNIIRAAEDGHGGDPALYRDYEVGPPAVKGR